MEKKKLIISPASCSTDVRCRVSSFELREIKQMLLSGNKEQITIAVGKVLSQINDNDCALEMITADISEFLCDAMLPFDSYVSGTIYNCLGIMTGYKYFFTHNHSSFALETVIRALNFIIKTGGHDKTVIQPLNIIILIVQGYARFDVMPEKKPFENLINLILVLLKRKSVSQEVKYQGGLIIKSLFEIESWKHNYAQNLMEICGKWFDLICVKGETCHSISQELTNLGCFLSEQALRYLINDGNKSHLLRDHDVDNESNTPMQIITNTITFLVDVVAPEVEKLLTSNQRQEIETLEIFFTSLIYIVNELSPRRRLVVQKLSKIGFIQIIKNILSQDNLRQYENLGKTCMRVLTEILLSLSDDVFNLTEMWPSGRDYFRKEVSVGMSLLPLNASGWVHKLSDTEVNRSSRLALIIYFYFYLLTTKSTSPELIYPSAIKLLDLSSEINCTRLLVKAVWFIFVMSQISEGYTSPELNSWATKKMLKILESQTEFSLIYTHHPALLYWTFSTSRTNSKIQCQVVKLWLENRSSDCTVLDDLMKKSADIRLALFQLLQDGSHNEVAHLAFSSLKSFMLKSDDDTLSCNIWFLLPQILAVVATKTFNAMKVEYIVELATLKVPLRPDITRTVRIATLLPEALQKSDMASSSPALKLALQLLEISVKYEDNRVLLAFLRSDNFMERIVTGVTADFTEISIISVKIITILWHMKFPCDQLPCYYKTINLDLCNVLKIFDSNDVELIKSGLLLMEQILSSKFKSLLVNVQGISTEFRRILFFRLENVLFKYLSTDTVTAWKCLQHCLELENLLTQDCFLHEVTKYGLQYLKETPEMVDFLIVWMETRTEKERFYDGSRGIKRNYFLETIEEVAVYLTLNFFEHWDRLSRKVLECCKHFAVDTSREPFKQIMERMRSHYQNTSLLSSSFPSRGRNNAIDIDFEDFEKENCW